MLERSDLSQPLADRRRADSPYTGSGGSTGAKAGPRLAFDVFAVAPAGHYLALRLGFSMPVEEVNWLPEHWVEEYTRRGYAVFDPLIRWVYVATGSCRWSALLQPDPTGILSRAKAHGLHYGAVVSIHEPGASSSRSFGIFAHSDREFSDSELAALTSYVAARHGAVSPPNLTPAEIEALQLVSDGHRLKQIAWQLGITEGAVKQRLKNARIKLGAKTGAEAISLAAAFQFI